MQANRGSTADGRKISLGQRRPSILFCRHVKWHDTENYFFCRGQIRAMEKHIKVLEEALESFLLCSGCIFLHGNAEQAGVAFYEQHVWWNCWNWTVCRGKKRNDMCISLAETALQIQLYTNGVEMMRKYIQESQLNVIQSSHLHQNTCHPQIWIYHEYVDVFSHTSQRIAFASCNVQRWALTSKELSANTMSLAASVSEGKGRPAFSILQLHKFMKLFPGWNGKGTEGQCQQVSGRELATMQGHTHMYQSWTLRLR